MAAGLEVLFVGAFAYVSWLFTYVQTLKIILPAGKVLVKKRKD
jgi:hypothetical protein